VASQHAILHTTLYDLSVQDLLDCDYYDMACMGGEVISALEFAINGQGGWFTTEALYPYVGYDGACKWDASTMQIVQISDAGVVKSGDEDGLLQAVCGFGPVAVEVDGSSLGFQLYTSGIYDNPDCSTMDLDTGLLVIGYGTEGGVDYWLCQNNWGMSWGEMGYIRMVRNKGNECGIATEAVYPVAV
jgi:cathepsin L